MTENCKITLLKSNRSTHSRRGFSLVEILVVLVVLLIGILALVRIFPFGFLTIQRTGEQTAAGSLSQQQLADLHNLAAPPEVIRAGLPTTQGAIQAIDSIAPDDLSEASAAELTALQAQYNFSLPNNYGSYFFSDVNRIRYIQGETFRVPIATPNGVSSQYGSVYLLQFGPVFNRFFTDPNTNENRDSLNVRGAAMNREVLSSAGSPMSQPDPTASIPDELHYAIDYANNRIAFFPRYADAARGAGQRIFSLTYSYYTGTTGPGAFQNATVKIAVNDLTAGAQPVAVWQAIPVLANSAIQPYTEQVSRSFRLVSQQTVEQTGTAPNFSNDPYEYAWYSRQEGDVNRGVLVFNPRGHVTVLDTSNTKNATDYVNDQTLTARIDYLTYDNHIIRDDRTMPDVAPYRVKLSLNLILSEDDNLPSKYVYTGLYTDPTIDNTGVTDTKDLVVINVGTGEEICDIVKGVSTTTSKVPAVLDAKIGVITFGTRDASAQVGSLDPAKLAPLKGASLRILYRTQKQWGMQVQRAAANYDVIVPDPNNLAVAFAQIDATHCLPGQGGGYGNPTRIYFASSEMGKTVSVGKFYRTTASSVANDPGSYPVDTNQTLRINDNTALNETIGGRSYTWVDIASIHPDATGFSTVPTGRAVSFVQGLSVRSRIVWLDTSRWRHVDNDTTIQTAQ